MVITSIHSADEKKSLLNMNISFFDRVSNKDIVILSRQLSTLFQAQVSALRIFRLLSSVKQKIKSLVQNLLLFLMISRAGSSISQALAKHPKVFSEFYVNMIKAGEETGKLDETFAYLADYLDRTYELVSKAKSALIYPAFVIITFISVMILMFTVVIPKIAATLTDSGQAIPVYTQIILDISNFLVSYGIFCFSGIRCCRISFSGVMFVRRRASLLLMISNFVFRTSAHSIVDCIFHVWLTT